LEGLEERTVPAVYHVNSLLDTSATGAGSGLVGDLRYAVFQSDFNPGSNTILFDVNGTITLQHGLLPIINNVTIQGPGAALLTIDAHNASRAFAVAPGVTAAISGVLIDNGNATVPWTLANDVHPDPFFHTEIPNDATVVAHFHPQLQILINGEQQVVPQGVGLFLDSQGNLLGGLPIHTHDDTGILHVESTEARTFVLNDFFQEWGQPWTSTQFMGYAISPAHPLTMTVNGVPSTAFGSLVLAQGQFIVISLDGAVRAPQGGNAIVDYQGGGIYNRGNLTLNGVNVFTSTAAGEGGGVYNGAGATLTFNNSSNISGNLALYGSAVANFNSTMVADHSYVTINHSTFAGAIYSLNSITVVTYTTISGNYSDWEGGAFFNASSTVAVVDSTLVNNSSYIGGAVFDYYSVVAIVNSTLSANMTNINGGNVGGAIYNNPGSTLVVWWSTLAENYATLSGGGIFNESGGTVNLFDTIIAKNTAGSPAHPDDVSGVFASQGNNLIGDGNGGSGFVASDFVGTAASPIDPLLMPLAFNGGFTQTYALMPGSPAIGHGGTQYAALLGTDQRGPGFARIVNGRVDIGAWERQT
jgi:hypothetical protein